MISWLLLGMVAWWERGRRCSGSPRRPATSRLAKAVANTLGAPNYSEVLTESTPQGKQTDYLVFQAPDRLGGYVQSGTKRTYVYVIGTTEYQSLTVAAEHPHQHLVFYRQPSQGAKALDPAHNYLSYAREAKHVTQSGTPTRSP